MLARISQFEDLDRQALDWKAVRLRVKRREEEHRRVVVAARRSLHLDVHVGGGEFFCWFTIRSIISLSV
ncbi:unnamed protein product [Hydatigera taeniaeformis]|uniref:Uncharacterized protein n=1 Tax=Hydatigena taeniaeformis TaxID=6205 RepID=A0A0R3WVV9_HYDTA|nr:unnamed protein product [Hydatigera taeniaeformis]